MLQRLQSSIPLLLIAGTTHAVELTSNCDPGCDSGCDNQKNDVGVAIDFNVNAPQPDHHHHHEPLPTELDLQVASIVAQLEAKQKEVEI